MPITINILFRHPRNSGVKKYVYALEEGKPFVIGRSQQTHFSIEDPNISRRHCVLLLDGGQIHVEDTSKNGTYLNEVLITQRHPLRDGDVVRIGESRLQISREAAQLIKDRELVGREFNGYYIESVLGAGNLGIVYKGIQRSMNRPVALKTLSHRHLSNRGMVERFLKVAKLAGLLSHPNIVQVYDSGQLDAYGLYYLVMEYVDGETLMKQFMKQDVLPVEQATQIIQQVGSALSFGHRRHVIHRDINPTNIMVTKSGIAKLVGLGLAKSLEGDVSQLTQSGTAMGMINYVAPEQLQDAARATHQADLFSLCAVFYRAVTGQTPLTAKSRKEYFTRVREKVEPPPAHEINPEVPKEMSRVMSRGLKFELTERYSSIDEMLEELSEIVRPRAFDTKRMLKARKNLLAMLPDPPDIPGYKFGVLFSPMEEVGGDFYDFFHVDEHHLGIVVGDISGHGIEAAVIVGMAKTLARLFGRQHESPSKALAAVNTEILPDLDGTTFVTCFYGVLDRSRRLFRFARGGHNPLLLWNPARPEPLQVFEPQGTVVGMVKEKFFHQQEVTLELEKDDLLVIYTDGVVEAQNGQEEFFDTSRLEELVRGYQPGEDLNGFLSRIHDAVLGWIGSGKVADDITLVAMRVED